MHNDGFARIINAPYSGTNVIFNPKVIWYCGKYTPNNKTKKSFNVQGDSNLVMYVAEAHNRVLWASNTANRGGSRLVLENNGNLVYYHSNGGIVWQSNSGSRMFNFNPDKNKNTDTIYSNQNILEDEYIMSKNKLNLFHVDDDGYARAFGFPSVQNNLSNIPEHLTYWACGTGTGSRHLKHFEVQGDSNLVLYTDNGNKHNVLWSSSTVNKGGVRFVLEDNRNLVFYHSNGGIVWQSGTAMIGPTVPEGTSLKCRDKSKIAKDNNPVYRWSYNQLMHYPDQNIARSWDPNWEKFAWYDCTNNAVSTDAMTYRPNDGDIIKCINASNNDSNNDDSNKLYAYNKSNNQLTYYPIITDNILRQYNNYTSSTVWNNTMVTTRNCSQYDPNRLELKTLQPLNTSTPDGTSLMCDKDTNSIFRYISNSDSLFHYNSTEIAYTWDANWMNYKLYDCSRIRNNNSGANYNVMTAKPSTGSILKCSDDNNYYRYSESGNSTSLFKYDTPAIAKQYSVFQILQGPELDIAIGKTNFAVQPNYDTIHPVCYTFRFECCIQGNSKTTRNIFNSSPDNPLPIGSINCRPAVYITGDDLPPANRIKITHSTTKNSDSYIISNFKATPGVWFTVTFIVNNRSMFTYFGNENEDKKKDKIFSNGTNFTWATGDKKWTWNASNIKTDGYVKVRNVFFWKFAMALHVPETFDPIEITDELNPYTHKPTGNKEYTTALPPPTNCKLFSNERQPFIPSQNINSTSIKDGTTLKCKNRSDKYRYDAEKNKIFKYPDDTIAESWDPKHANYKLYDCANFLDDVGIMDKKPIENDLIKCTDDQKSYRYVNDTNTLEWYMNDNIIKQYNPDLLNNQQLSRNCNQFKKDRTTFYPTQKLGPSTTSLHEGTPLKCNNKPEIYRYNSRYDILMKYPSEIIANTWDTTAWKGFYSYDCSQSYITNNIMNERPKQDTVIKCFSETDPSQENNKFYYTYNYEDNSLKPYPSIDSIQRSFPKWDINNIKKNDCRQYYIREPAFYKGPNGTLEESNIDLSNYDKCNKLPYSPTRIENRSLIRDGENILLYTDPYCKNIFTNIEGNKQKDKAVNITYTPTNAMGIYLEENNPTHYKIVSDDEYYAQYPN